MMRTAPIGRLHVLTDTTLQSRYGHVELARLAALGGADIVQYRDKPEAELHTRIERVRRMQQALAGSGATLCVNDRVDVALACGVPCVHLGGEDMQPALARKLLGAAARIGATANSLAQARARDVEGVDYLGVGPVFGTKSKAAAAPRLGTDMLRRIVRAVSRPVVAIGGITPSRTVEVLETGVHGIAVLSAVVCSEDPQQATRRFREEIDRFLGVLRDERRADGAG